MTTIARSANDWRKFVSGCLDFRPEDRVFRVARAMFTEPELFDLEMEMIFEKNWIYACHESEIRQPHDSHYVWTCPSSPTRRDRRQGAATAARPEIDPENSTHRRERGPFPGRRLDCFNLGDSKAFVTIYWGC